ncbi:Protein of unknown function [Propionibacterium freudenreichii subsp. freudenreichii]|uniref:Uncharacterized protein n=1 Tax=Propionibacterium freudenreichii subsp. freudenreichii TaxID=66712 RepID=A0A0B7NV68_PROFF|nr:Protein of unknown function [Propionibacterium freudenreichii]CEP26596.1 Protein of unknown function [Propionibacterium freudenreichii subsp. freudenreichii]CEH05084.1 Protein of unknown function [Propionibacterium freudenreichii]CEH07003.1 Protein of unknown function [Propionibacterium freudenreichii]CEH08014.1 Protein of unknown function [Propionibacterium freudenreichii]
MKLPVIVEVCILLRTMILDASCYFLTRNGLTAPEAVPLSRLALLDTVLSRGDPRESLELLRRMTPISPTDLSGDFKNR